MIHRSLAIYLSFFACFGYAFAQQRTDTIKTKGTPGHVFLNIEVTSSNFFIGSSQRCGINVTRIQSQNPNFQQKIREKRDMNGNLIREVAFNQQGSMQAKSIQMAPSNLNPLMRTTTANATEFHAEPDVPTDLQLFLGHGASELDLSGLNFHNVAINSSFSDVIIKYDRPNQSLMRRMDVHTGKADVILENIELARAEVISVQTGMGSTRIVLNNKEASSSSIHISSAVGDCELVIHEEQPTQIILRNSFFAKVFMESGQFKRLNRTNLVNVAYLQLEDKSEAVRIVCNLDFGKLYIHNYSQD